jgi:predicted ATP-grasp superfamily ATP-dependent carboligase
MSFSIVLASAGYGGTIAAARDLGMRGFDVTIVSSDSLGAAAWSRHAKRVYSAPPESCTQSFLERLQAIGAANPGGILLPTSDETVWMYAENAAFLKHHFRLYHPSIASLRQILDKKLFSDSVVRAGLALLPSWNPRNLDEVAALAPSLPYPILIKPRTHVHRLESDKGVVVSTPPELIEQYRLFVNRERAMAAVNTFLNDHNLPTLQQFVRVGREGVLSVTGFIDRTGELFVTRAASKVFQRSLPAGIGICFEPVRCVPELSAAVRRLCRELGYFGIFEVEFVRLDGHWAPIDFNPRLFNQVGMDIRRGMPLPLLACLDAAGDSVSLRDAVEKAQMEDGEEVVFCDRFMLRAILYERRLTGRISDRDFAHWRAWAKSRASRGVDFALDRRDPGPGAIHALSEVLRGVRAAPRLMCSTPLVFPAIPNRLKKEPS